MHPNGRVQHARPGLARRLGAEGLAAFALVFAGCGAIVANAQHDARAVAEEVAAAGLPVEFADQLVLAA